jgi:hypothetical protein
MDPLDLIEGKDAERRVGTLSIGDDAAARFRSRGQVLRDLVIAALLVPAAVAAIAWQSPSVAVTAVGVAVCLAYCVVAFFVRARPNHDHIGPVAGTFDHPFRFSDDANRALMAGAVILAPGRYVSVSLVDGIRLLKSGKLPHQRLLG